MKYRLCILFSSLLGLGHIPGAPGTYGSLVTVIVFFLLYRYTGGINPALHLSAIGLISIAGILASDLISRRSGREDPSFIIIDEVAGQLLTLLFLPVSLPNLIIGFLAFRVFDMWKPFPIRKLEPLKGGVGVMADDLLAGVYANILLRLINVFL